MLPSKLRGLGALLNSFTQLSLFDTEDEEQ